MKVALNCNSLLLTKSLELFLKDYLVSTKSCDVVISDHNIDIEKPIFMIGKSNGSNLQVPFSKSDLIIELKNFYESSCESDEKSESEESDSLEQQIAKLSEKFQDDLIKLIKAHHEK